MIKLKHYRDTWLSEKTDEIIGFYPREFYPLDNFSSFKVEWNGYLYTSLEEAFQSRLFLPNNPEIAEQIKKSHSAHEAQKIMFENIDKVRYSKDEQVLIMEELLRLKIEQNPYVKKKLLQTEDYLIVEDSPKDSFWGWGINRDGLNQLGKLWMKIRDELKNQKIEYEDNMVELVRQNYSKNKKIFNNIKRQLQKELGINIKIDHVGSTAIKNMHGKNIIDILIGAEDIDNLNKISKKLINMGYCPGKNISDNINRFFASTYEETKSGDIHIHLVIKDTERYKEFLLLRDYLINNKDIAKNYSDFKRELIANNIKDRKEYKKIKADYVSNLISQAKKVTK